MKVVFLAILLAVPFVNTEAQHDTVSAKLSVKSRYQSAGEKTDLVIYPVPVREKSFTIKSSAGIVSIRITNIIGQQVLSLKYSSPVHFTKIDLDNPERGLYLVTITFSDNTRLIRKILIESMS